MPVDGLAPLPSRSPRALAPGDVVAGRYRVVKPLGRGSFGHTYLAVDTAAGDREVALKQLRAEGEGGWKALELFERDPVLDPRVGADRPPALLGELGAIAALGGSYIHKA